MSNKALANAERVADEAIELTVQLNGVLRGMIDKIEKKHAMPAMRELINHADGEAKRLRDELEGHG
jgi:hypothetical protein